MKRIQIHIDSALEQRVAALARSRGISKAAVIRQCVEQSLPPAADADDPWERLIGHAVGVEPADDIDAVIYG